MDKLRKYLEERFGKYLEKLFEPITHEFYSVETDDLFRNCIQCNCNLMEIDDGYIIEKVISNDDTIYEFALCDKCLEGLGRQYSKESIKHINRFYRKERKLKGDLSRCNFCLVPREELTTYSLIAICIDDRLIKYKFPVLGCENCFEILMEGLSEKTKGEIDRFVEKNFPSPSFGKDIPQGKPVIMI